MNNWFFKVKCSLSHEIPYVKLILRSDINRIFVSRDVLHYIFNDRIYFHFMITSMHTYVLFARLKGWKSQMFLSVMLHSDHLWQRSVNCLIIHNKFFIRFLNANMRALSFIEDNSKSYKNTGNYSSKLSNVNVFLSKVPASMLHFFKKRIYDFVKSTTSRKLTVKCTGCGSHKK